VNKKEIFISLGALVFFFWMYYSPSFMFNDTGIRGFFAKGSLEREVKEGTLKVAEKSASFDFFSLFHKEARVLFVGDSMFDRTIRSRASTHGENFIFSCVKDFLTSFDVVVANLEGPVTSFDSKSVGTVPGQEGNTTFTFSPTIPKVLFDHNVRVVSLGNNHITDFGREGVEMTRLYLKKASVDYFGDPFDSKKKSTVVSVPGATLGIVGYNQFLGVDTIAQTVEEIERLNDEVDHVIVFSHWGDEYVDANQFQKSSARIFIDAGADVVFGAHPHVIQKREEYKGKTIYYSLGNFVFDQYWDDSVRKGLGVEMVVRGDELSFVEHVFELGRDGRTCLVLE